MYNQMTKEEKKYYWWLWAVKLFGKLLKVFTDKTVLSPKHWRVYYDEGKDSTDLENINVCNKSGDHYFDQEIHNLLSLPFQQSEETKKVH